MNFLNADGCFLSKEAQACAPDEPSDKWISLDEDTFDKIYKASGAGDGGTRYLYVMDGLRQEKNRVDYDPPCTPGESSRWVPSDCGSSGFTANDSTADIFADLLANSDDENPYVRDVSFPIIGIECHSSDRQKFDFKVKLRSGGGCWKNVHRSNLQVFDFTDWVSRHPGGEDAITQFVDLHGDSRFHIVFPDWHGMDRFATASEYITDIGTYGDSIPFSRLPEELTTKDIAEALEMSDVRHLVGPTVVCGSPFEVGSSPSKAGPRFRHAFGIGTMTGSPVESFDKDMTWISVALQAKDGLRQRVAWALSQVFSLTESDIRGGGQSEPWMVRRYLT